MSTNVKSGNIWERTPRVRSQVVRRVCEALEKTYGCPRLGNPQNSVDDLVYIIISNKTSPKIAQRTYKMVKQGYPNWDCLLPSHISHLKTLLKPAGLASVKSRQIIGALKNIRRDYGICDLSKLRVKSNEEIQTYLTSLPGVSEKVAKCVMMYTLDIDVLPVDSHIHRITRRLGWTARKRADQCHRELESLVPAKRRYAFHVDCIIHGREICRPHRPKCIQCCISRYCMYNKTIEE